MSPTEVPHDPRRLGFDPERLARLAKQYTLPTSSYTITSTFGQAGSMWSSGHHTGLDFAAPTGTLIKAIHSGTITQAGWAGAYGYRTVLTLDDGTELWFCHQSSITVSVGQKVNTGDVIGRVGATGNVTGSHLHLEVRVPDAATSSGQRAVDPMIFFGTGGATGFNAAAGAAGIGAPGFNWPSADAMAAATDDLPDPLRPPTATRTGDTGCSSSPARSR